MNSAKEILSKINSLFEENKKAVFVSSLLIFLFAVALIIFSVQKCTTKSVKKIQTLSLEPFTPDQELLLPSGISIPEGYTLSRETKEKWTTEEAEKWFTNPTESVIKKLENDNDKIISNILGSAP